jgi:hypothetical protein
MAPEGVGDERPSVDVIERAGGLDITLPRVDGVRTKKANRHLAASVLAVYEISLREKSRDKQRELFTELLLKLLARW